MWRCRECGGEVIEKETNHYPLDENGDRKFSCQRDTWYECIRCGKKEPFLKTIAENNKLTIKGKMRCNICGSDYFSNSIHHAVCLVCGNEGDTIEDISYINKEE